MYRSSEIFGWYWLVFVGVIGVAFIQTNTIHQMANEVDLLEFSECRNLNENYPRIYIKVFRNQQGEFKVKVDDAVIRDLESLRQYLSPLGQCYWGCPEPEILLIVDKDAPYYIVNDIEEVLAEEEFLKVTYLVKQKLP